MIKKFRHVKKEGIVFDINAIKRILPHRYPFLLVDKIIELELDKKVVGVKAVTGNEPFFEGHFPDYPVMPGVLIVEALAQASGILLLNALPDPKSKLVLFMSITNAKFRKPVVPGDQLILEAELITKRPKYFAIKGAAYVENTLVAEAEFMAAIVDRDQPKNIEEN